MNELILYGAPALSFGLGYFIAYRARRKEQHEDFRQTAEDNWRLFVDACKEANDIEEELNDALASNQRLTDALQAKNERLERIVTKGRESKSGSAVHLARIAEGLA